MWADVDTDVDFVNYEEIAELAGELIRRPQMLPISLGIFGGWGAGKSSLLRLLEKNLTSDDKFIVVKFDAWLYQDFDDARAALMEVVASNLLSATTTNEGLKKKILRFSERINYFRGLGLLAEAGASIAGYPTLGFLSRGIESVGNLLSGNGEDDDVTTVKDSVSEVGKTAKELVTDKKTKTPPSEITAFRQEFSQILSEMNKTLVVFIDNLDRCLPKNAIHTLEAVRLFLFLPNTAFVIAADEEMIRHSVSEFYGSLNDRLVTDYLDKLIQIPIRVPRLGVHEVRAYLFMLAATAEGLPLDQLDILRTEIIKDLRECWKSSPTTKEHLLKAVNAYVTDELKSAFSIADRVAPILATSSMVQGNPRIVKRMMNMVKMRSSIARKRGIFLDEAIITKIALLERCTENATTAEFYRFINESSDGKPKIFAECEAALDDFDKFNKTCPETLKKYHSFLFEWFRLEPFLAGIDLRPALYLSREILPLRYSKDGLSSNAAEAVSYLLKVKSSHSPTAKAALSKVQDSELKRVMEEIISELKKEASWTTKPQGIDGAILLAEISSDTGQMLSDFILSLGLKKYPPWMSALLKNSNWFSGKEPYGNINF